ncbi:MAG: Protease Do [Candidatus Moranbacteria bacterium GW2011_GWE1_35_17]|nr:MAG: Protease Do [Candidatus Moranbacteria bacterium GW2011_GWE1_35_17]KKP72646.1 MAG: Protease Do [Candidatus Moranbacteria bacterium GW2011_GWE2_35_164]KKP82698.1 MAG: Protease Do [Candidatus Moranbacteria bacterium GW2011_GWF1_35_5]
MENNTIEKKEEIIKEAEITRETSNIAFENKKDNKPKNKLSIKIWLIIILGMFLSSILGGFFGFMAGGFSGMLSNKLKNKVENKLGLNNDQQQEEKGSIFREESAVIDVVEKNSPAVVNIVITKDIPKFRNNGFNFFFDPFGIEDESSRETEKQKVGGGTGFFVSSDGMIVTNKHVVSDETAQYTVITTDEKEYTAQVLARHPSLDVAIIKIDGVNFPVLNLGDSSALKVGQSVIAIGNSLGEFSNSVSFGIVSGLKRDITAGSGYGDSEKLTNIIQTDAAINPGNSGGPLLDIKGNVVGVNVAVAQGVENIGFAISVNDIKKTIEQVKNSGKISIPYIGIRYIMLNEEIQTDNNLPYNYGALISRGEKITDFAVIPGSPADKAGLVENDIILEINGKKVEKDNQINSTIASLSIGEEITLKIWHKGEEKEIQLKLEERM